MILQFSIIELRILFGLSSASSFAYFSAMKSVWISSSLPLSWCSLTGIFRQLRAGWSRLSLGRGRSSPHQECSSDSSSVFPSFRSHSLQDSWYSYHYLHIKKSTLYSNCPKQRERVHFPMSLSYWMNPPAFSILSLSSPLLWLYWWLLEGDQGWVGRGLRFWKCIPCSLRERRHKLCSLWSAAPTLLLHKSEQGQDTSGRTHSQASRNSCSWGSWSFHWDLQLSPREESIPSLSQWGFLWCTPCTLTLRDRRTLRRDWSVSTRFLQCLPQSVIHLPCSVCIPDLDQFHCWILFDRKVPSELEKQVSYFELTVEGKRVDLLSFYFAEDHLIGNESLSHNLCHWMFGREE